MASAHIAFGREGQYALAADTTTSLAPSATFGAIADERRHLWCAGLGILAHSFISIREPREACAIKRLKFDGIVNGMNAIMRHPSLTCLSSSSILSSDAKFCFTTLESTT